MIPGEYILANEPIECNVGRATVKVAVVNTGDRPVQIGSHFHFIEAFETNVTHVLCNAFP